MVQAFADLSGDVNPLHVDAEFAAARGYSRPVAHGLLALGAISRLIGTELPGPGALWMAEDVQFVRPVFVGDTVRASVTVEHVSAAAGVVTLRTEARLERTGETVLTGKARVGLVEARAAASPARAPDASSVPRPAAAAGSGRVALVTGGSRGVGAAIATALAADGHAVAVHYRDREGAAAAVVAAIRAAGGEATAFGGDLGVEDGPDRLYDEVVAACGRIDVLVNSATPPIVPKALLDGVWTDVQAYLDVYVRATLRLVQRAAPGMQERRFGRVVNVLSSYAFGVPPPRLAAYVTAKSALAGLSRAMAVELGPLGITVNMLAPSVLLTEQTEGMSDRARQLHASQTPLRRLATPDDVAAAVRFLAGDQAGFVTGAVLPVAGGTIMP